MSSITEVISRWSTLIEDFSMSSQDFYAQVAKAIEKRQIPERENQTIQGLKESILFLQKHEY